MQQRQLCGMANFALRPEIAVVRPEFGGTTNEKGQATVEVNGA